MQRIGDSPSAFLFCGIDGGQARIPAHAQRRNSKMLWHGFCLVTDCYLVRSAYGLLKVSIKKAENEDNKMVAKDEK